MSMKSIKIKLKKKCERPCSYIRSVVNSTTLRESQQLYYLCGGVNMPFCGHKKYSDNES